MRVAHLIIVHKNPDQLLRLVKRLQHSNFDLFIHVDRKVPLEQFMFIKSEADLSFIKNRVTCQWGGQKCSYEHN